AGISAWAGVAFRSARAAADDSGGLARHGRMGGALAGETAPPDHVRSGPLAADGVALGAARKRAAFEERNAADLVRAAGFRVAAPERRRSRAPRHEAGNRRRDERAAEQPQRPRPRHRPGDRSSQLVEELTHVPEPPPVERSTRSDGMRAIISVQPRIIEPAAGSVV